MINLVGRTLGPYRLLDQLGLGGMATVYRAYHAAMDRYVAIKVLPQHMAAEPTFRARFDQEARTIARLEHRHILPIYDAGEHQGFCYLIMRYSEGGTLSQLIDRGALTIAQATRFASQIGQALACAHANGVVHRDVKPANVLIDRNGDALLTDFGIAKIIEGTLSITGDGALVGTPAYMAPEQVRGKAVDGRTDLYALGIILYEALTGTRPFEAETPLAVALMQIYNPLRPPRQVNPAVPETLERIMLRALAKDPADRFPTADAMVRALDEALATLDDQLAPGRPAGPAGSKYATLQLPEHTTALSPRPSSTVMIDRRRLREAIDALAAGRSADVLPLLQGLPLDDANVGVLRQEALNQLVRQAAAPPLTAPGDTAASAARDRLDRLRLDLAERAPYLGLESFQEQDAAFFFGRADVVDALLAKVQHAPFLAVLGPSGSGKSSVTLAGLLPALRRSRLSGAARWRFLTFRPGARPLDALAVALTSHTAGGLDAALAMIERLAADQAALLAPDLLGDEREPVGLALVVDQFEELWTQAPQPAQVPARPAADEQRRLFVRLLLTGAAAARDHAAPLRIILTMRADFLHRAAEDRELADWISAHNAIVSPMSAGELREVIERPAEAIGSAFEPGLVDELIAQVEGQPGTLPLLEYTLLELWKSRRADGTLTWGAFRALGGVDGALAARADAILAARYTPQQRDNLRRLLVRLVQPGEGAADTRRRVPIADLVSVGESAEDVSTLLRPLIDERLLTASRDPVSGAETLEVSHEALIRAWPTLSAWVNEVREDLRLHLQIEEAATEWLTAGEHPDLLWSGLRLDRAREWRERARPPLNERTRRFLDASLAAEAARAETQEASRRERERLLFAHEAERRDAARLRVFLAVTVALLLLALFFAGFAIVSRQQALSAESAARQAAGVAERARIDSQLVARAGEALVELDRQPDRAVLLALSAIPTDTASYPPMVARALYASFDAVFARVRLRGHSEAILAVAWSPDGRFALTAGADGTARIWNAASRANVHTLQAPAGALRSAAWSPDGRLILTGGADGAARVWDAASGAEVRVVTAHTGVVQAVAWSPDGRRFLTGGADRIARVWDTTTGTALQTLSGHGDAVRAVAWNPDGTRALTASDDGTAMVWEIASGKSVLTLRGHAEQVLAAAWSPAGDKLLTGSADATARTWDAATGQSIQILRGHADWIYSVAWSPDGRHVLTGSADKTAQLWDVSEAPGSKGLAYDASWLPESAWSPNGQRIVAGGPDKRPLIRDAATGARIATLDSDDESIKAAAWDAAGERLLIGGDKVEVWDAARGKRLRTLRASGPAVYAVAWSPDGQRALGGDASGAVTIWQVASGAVVRSILADASAVFAVAWSPDGHLALSGGQDGRAHIWDAATGAEVRALTGHSSYIYAVAWSPDGQLILTGGADGTARIWSAATGGEVRALTGHAGAVYGVAWSPDGRLVLTASADGTARAWDAATGAEVRTIQGHVGSVLVAGWSADGRLALTGATDGVIRVWMFDAGVVVAELKRRACGLFSDGEIRDVVTGWRGCGAELRASGDGANAYESFIATAAATPTLLPRPTATATATASPTATATTEPTATRVMPTLTRLVKAPAPRAQATPIPQSEATATLADTPTPEPPTATATPDPSATISPGPEPKPKPKPKPKATPQPPPP